MISRETIITFVKMDHGADRSQSYEKLISQNLPQGSFINEVTVLGEGGSRLCDNCAKAFAMMIGVWVVKNCPS